VFLQGVDQTAPIGASDTNWSTSSGTLSTSPLATYDGDMVFVAGACGNSGSYTVENGFIEAVEQDIPSADAVSGYKPATGVDETPALTHSNVNRNVILGFVVQAAP
jgi:hypothetical protein